MQLINLGGSMKSDSSQSIGASSQSGKEIQILIDLK